MVQRNSIARAAAGILGCIHGGAAQYANCTGDWLLFECEPPPPAPAPCSVDAQRSWVVETSAQAQTLAAAVNCSGGLFEVEWRGWVVVENPIYVVDGTVLTVSGAGTGAVIDGNATTRLFTVVDAALHVSGVNISSGASLVGGGIAATRSTVALNRTNLIGNTATAGSGGGVYASDGSTVSCVGGENFVDNSASVDGGALFANGGSMLSWSGDIELRNNSCDHWGGALAVESSSLVATGNVKFVGNSATGDSGYGGAISAHSGSSVVWGEGVMEFQGNFAGYGGGAVAVHPSSELSWSGYCRFTDNAAGVEGGALVLGTSTAYWSGSSEFVGNYASKRGGAISANWDSGLSWTGSSFFAHNSVVELNGGAISLLVSRATWAGEAVFFNNSAEKFGGAIYAYYSSTVVSTGNTSFVSNRALNDGSGFGGAIKIHFGSRMTWSGAMTRVEDNYAGNGGGGVAVAVGSELSWSGRSHFSGNVARNSGGALTVSSSSVHWVAETKLVGNVAQSGGAIFIYNGSDVSWTAETKFLSNEALSDGGAIAAPSTDVSWSPLESALAIAGTTAFANNTSGANGGALALLGGCSVAIGTVGLEFRDNNADVAGGAVFVSSTGLGPTFWNVSFVSNSAQVGGAVSTIGSGNKKDATSTVALHPTTFDRCRFNDNEASATGGAVDSAAGQDVYSNSVFEGNKARTGGALRLAGTASVDNCSYVENVSDDGEGAAVSNIGSISSMANVFFGGNAFDCEPGTFLDFNPSNPFEAVCDGCQILCENCSYEEPFLEPTCTEVSDHFNSSGGNTTIETLLVDPGYWRASVVSENVFGCYNADACLGGETGTADYCLEGYEGPYCAICSDGYTAQLGSVCMKCLSRANGVVLAAFLLVGVILAAIVMASYVMSGKHAGMQQRLFDRWARLIPLQSLKVVIVSWQILTQFTSVANVTFPDVYQDFLEALDVFNFDLGWVLSAGCFIDADFHDRLLISTIGPIAALLFLAGTYGVASSMNRGEDQILRSIWNKHVSMVLLLTFVVYSSVSATLFSAFACDDLDGGKTYLRADYRIECDSSKHKAIQVYAGFMIVVYAVGIPAFYGFLLFRDREILRRDQAHREASARVTSISDLWEPYKPSVYYYEVIECVRRVSLAGVVVFIYPDTAAQIAITLMMAFVFVVLSEILAPYASQWDAWISRMGHAVIFTSMYVALLVKVDVSDERASSQKVFEAFLITVHTCMILVVLIETVVLAWALKAEQREEPGPRFRVSKTFSSRREEVAPADGGSHEEDFYEEERAPWPGRKGERGTTSHSCTHWQGEV